MDGAAMIKINLDKAKEILKDRVRAERAPMLSSLDVEFMRAVEAGDTQKQQEIASKKQSLRDATKAVDLISSVEEIKASSASDYLQVQP